MGSAPPTVPLEAARRLTVTKQHLAGRLPSGPSRDSLLSVVRDLAYVQWDPVTVVAPSHLISLWSRVGGFRASDLEALLWEEKKLFEHWTPMASLVLTEDYPLYASLMRRYPDSLTSSWGSQRTRARRFLTEHAGLRRRILRDLRSGPRSVSEFEAHEGTRRDDGDWAASSDVTEMLFHLLMRGEAMVVGHRGAQNLWGLTEQFLPASVKREPLSEQEFERTAAQRALRALGTATEREIRHYYPRGRYRNLKGTLAHLEKEAVVHRIRIEALGPRDERFVHDDDLPLLESLQGRDWVPRTSLLPPFDNMLYSTERTSRLFGFHYIREQFLPKEKRRFGTYVLPILRGDQLIGRIDPVFEKATRTLRVLAVHAEPEAPTGRSVGSEVAETLRGLAQFIGADRVTYTSRVPRAWKSSLE